MNLTEVKNIYFLGIGGIGMSALARYFNKEGKEIFGYDRVETRLTKKLVDEGMMIHYRDDVSMIPDNIDMVIYTPAIPQTHAEFTWLRTQELPIYKRSEVLGLISKEQKVIGVAGTHGKTSTSAIMSDIVRKAGHDLTAFVGGIMKEYNSNFLHGTSDYVVVEADEFDRSFLRLYPEIAVIQAMDADHLDIYGTAVELEQAFFTFCDQINDGGKLWISKTIESKLLSELRARMVAKNISIRSFGINEGDLAANDIRIENGQFVFDLVKNDQSLGKAILPMAGEHNVRNALAAIAVGLELGLSAQDLIAALESFQGIKRRFEFVYKSDDLVVIDDYAHHPEELKAAIAATRKLFPEREITGIFQPHLYSRTSDFAVGFGEALSALDKLYLTQIYPARELPMEGVTSQLILDKVRLKNKTLIDKKDIPTLIKPDEHEVILFVGAGDVDVQIPLFLDKINA